MIKRFCLSLLSLPLFAVAGELQPPPLTSTEVGAYLQSAEQRVGQVVAELMSIPDGGKTVENTMRPWNQLSNEILDSFGVLTFVAQSGLPASMDAAMGLQHLGAFLYFSLFQNIDLYRSLRSYVFHSLAQERELSSYDHYQIDTLLGSCEQIKSSLSEEEEWVHDSLREWNSYYEMTPYRYLKGDVEEKVLGQDLSVLTLNTCCTPGLCALLFGGVSLPWQERIGPLAEKILSVDADVVCLQEVQAEEACEALYELLKERYTHFYVAVGPRCLGFSMETVGLSSGLFVASKYAIDNPQFTLFSVSGFAMNYGFFDFVVKNGQIPMGHIYTTHMQSLEYDQFAQIRAQQLAQIIGKIESDFVEGVPAFLCGDLNVPYGSNEPSLALMQDQFYDDYNQGELVSADNRTCTDYFTNYYFSQSKDPAQIDPKFQIIDYALLYNKSLLEGFQISTQLMPMNDLDDPQNAVTDHHGLLTTISPTEVHR